MLATRPRTLGAILDYVPARERGRTRSSAAAVELRALV